MERNYFAAIEINNIYSSCLVMNFVLDDHYQNDFDHFQLYPVAYDKVLTSGFSDGYIVDPILFENTLHRLLDEIKRKFKIDVDEAIMVLPNNKHVVLKIRKDFKIKTEKQIIHKAEIQQCRKDLVNTLVLNNSTYIEDVTCLYTLENKLEFRTEPIDYSSPTLNLLSNVHTLPIDLVSSFVDEFNKNNINILGAYINCDCSAMALSKQYELEDDTICIDIGQDTTTIAAYQKSLLEKSSRVNFGLKHIIEALSLTLQISFADALIMFDSYFVANLDLASEIIIDKQKNINEKRICGIVLNSLTEGIDLIVHEVYKIKNDLQLNMNCNYKLSGLLNDHRGFVDKFIELSNLPVASNDFEVLGIDDVIYKNCYGAIVKFINNQKDYIKERLTIDETYNLKNPSFELNETKDENNNEDEVENVSNATQEKKNDSTRRHFQDFFED